MFWFKRVKTTPSVSEIAYNERKERLDRFYKKLFEMHDKGSIKNIKVIKPNAGILDVCN